jgi:hypothetical protein
MASPRIKQILIPRYVQASNLPAVLHRVAPKMTIFKRLTFGGFDMSAPQAEEAFGVLLRSSSDLLIAVLLDDYNEDEVNALAHFIRESSSLVFLFLFFGDGQSERLSETSFRSLCDAVSESSSLHALTLLTLPVHELIVDRASESLAQTFVNSKSVKIIRLNENKTGGLTTDRILHALLRTTAGKDFEVCFRKSTAINSAGHVSLNKKRTNPFKHLLPQNIPLGLWPRVLAKADNWDKEDSHSSLDFLFFLMREKNDVLLQNVRRRRIRKRKRFEI